MLAGIRRDAELVACSPWVYGATAARLTPDQKVGSSNLSGLIWDSLALCNSHGLGGELCGLGKQLIN